MTNKENMPQQIHPEIQAELMEVAKKIAAILTEHKMALQPFINYLADKIHADVRIIKLKEEHVASEDAPTYAVEENVSNK